MLQGLDSDGRPVLLCNLAAHTPGAVDKGARQHALIWCMEHVVQLADKSPSSNGRCIMIFNLQGYSLQNLDTDDAAALVDILQKQYPERLLQLFIYDAPAIFWILWNMISPFLTASTSEKVQLVSGQSGLQAIHAVVPAELLPESLGGTAPLRPFADALQTVLDDKDEDSCGSAGTNVR
jgi:hypothetical protein